eukprot:CAMPEP_0115072110 /NCGR_PEP_ID=MMETSP0227-20121206/14044_1 /TAXON_ID=89957 /ORGANISM="Polarella glacialis, Strain CCMP 1383" /LENGTH=621 /DNA_ID=CAMNT_0002458813 /DNA_START=99 /DNA_END=1964 /DNA_ORIENTATION=+
MPKQNQQLCPESYASGNLSRADLSGQSCVANENCVCANSSHIRELVNVTVDGRACYACETRRPPACTEASDQCTPEACECANPWTHVKQHASTVDGTPCNYCEPIGGAGYSFGQTEMMVAATCILAVAVWQFAGRKPAAGARVNGSLRMARRQGDRSRAIRIQQEPLRWYEEVLLTLGDAFDVLVDGTCELLGAAWSLVCSICSLISSAIAWVVDLLDRSLGSSCAALRSLADGVRAACVKAVVFVSSPMRSRPKPAARPPKPADKAKDGLVGDRGRQGKPVPSAAAAPPAATVAVASGESTSPAVQAAAPAKAVASSAEPQSAKASAPSAAGATGSTATGLVKKKAAPAAAAAATPATAAGKASKSSTPAPAKVGKTTAKVAPSAAEVGKTTAKVAPSAAEAAAADPPAASVQAPDAGDPSSSSSEGRVATSEPNKARQRTTKVTESERRGAPRKASAPKDHGPSETIAPAGAKHLPPSKTGPSPIYRAALAVMKAADAEAAARSAQGPSLPQAFDEVSTDGDGAANTAATDGGETASSGPREDCDLGGTFLKVGLPVDAAGAVAYLRAAVDHRAAALDLLEAMQQNGSFVECRTFLIEPCDEVHVLRRTVSESDIALYL